MTILSAQSIRKIQPVTPFHERTVFEGMTFGLGPAGYDIRIKESISILPADGLILASSIEEFWIPKDILGVVHDKSSWCRLGLTVQNTVLEPGWRGFLTLELTNHLKNGAKPINIRAGSPIAQVVFHQLDAITDQPYKGKYQNQPEGPQPAILET